MAFTFAILLHALFGVVEASRIVTSHDSLESDEAIASGKMRVEVLLVRQGHSCSNALFQQGEKGGKSGTVADAKALPKSVKYLDAPLTNCGKHQSKLTGSQLRNAVQKKNWTPDYILTSSLMRAMQTATLMFPGKKVYPIPFIRETAVGPFKGALNKPRDLEKQQTILKKEKVDWQFTPNTTGVLLNDPRLKTKSARASGQRSKYSPKNARLAASYPAFRAYLGEQVIPPLLERKDGSGNTLRLAVVGHGNFFKKMLAKFFQCKTLLINNDGMFAMYDYDSVQQSLTEVVGNGSCEKPMPDGPWVNWEKPYLCPKDYKTCYKNEGEKFMGGTDDADIGSEYVSNRPDDNDQGCCIDQSR